MLLEPLVRDKKEDTPQTILDAQQGVFELAGRSLPEDATTFYDPIVTWLASYAQTPNPASEFIFKFEYYNTATSRTLIRLFDEIAKIPNATVVWYYDPADAEDEGEIDEVAQDLSALSGIPFDFRPIE
jgi:hypothetical protein